jgi:hypothetical protein
VLLSRISKAEKKMETRRKKEGMISSTTIAALQSKEQQLLSQVKDSTKKMEKESAAHKVKEQQLLSRISRLERRDGATTRKKF